MTVSRRFAAGLLLVFAALFGASCSSPGPGSPHDCLDEWGGSDCEALIAIMDGLGASHAPDSLNHAHSPLGPGWAKRLDDDATFQSLLQLKNRLEEARGQPVVPQARVGGIPQNSTLDGVRTLSERLRTGLGVCNAPINHPTSPAPCWLDTVCHATGGSGPTDPAVIAMADKLLLALKEAVDM